MSFITRFVLPCVLFVLFGATLNSARAWQETIAEAQARTKALEPVTKDILENADIAKYYAACPAGILADASPFHLVNPDISTEKQDALYDQCSNAPGKCFEVCTADKNPHVCFALARVYEYNFEPAENSEDINSISMSGRLFAYSCALGSPGGCTNRAAGIRNAGQAFERKNLSANREEAQACLLKTFEVACDKEDAWGCAMFAQAIQNGEGTQIDTKKAKKYYEKACAIDPKFEACDFAKRKMQ